MLFLVFVELMGTMEALVAALAWSLSCAIYRLSTGRRVPGLIVLSTIGLAAKTMLALATGSVFVYFLQPTITTALVGGAFLVSVCCGRPLAEKLAHDFCPFDPDTASHPEVRRFFSRLSLLWALTSLINACVTLWLLLTQSVTTFVLVKSFMGPSFTLVTLLLGGAYFRFRAARVGLQLQFARPQLVAY
jgi:intracellular septation protein A